MPAIDAIPELRELPRARDGRSSRGSRNRTSAVVVSVAACDQSNQSEQITTPNRGVPDAAARTRTDAHATPPVTFRNDATGVRPAPGTVTDIDAGLCNQLPDGGWGASACAVCP